MSWDDPFDDSDDPRKALRKWLGDFLPDEIFQNLEEMMDQLFREVAEGDVFDPKRMEEFMRSSDSISPFVFGFSVKVGPDGKPVIQRFGNRPAPDGSRLTPELEPLVDVIEENDEIIVVAELPGVEHDQVKVKVKGKTLTIDVTNPERPYHKSIELPTKVKKEQATSAMRNGVLEVRLKKA
ncbi:MAG: archaeal heat shock protein Hsp20 [Candidatus Thorarchaeota archaeon]